MQHAGDQPGRTSRLVKRVMKSEPWDGLLGFSSNRVETIKSHENSESAPAHPQSQFSGLFSEVTIYFFVKYNPPLAETVTLDASGNDICWLATFSYSANLFNIPSSKLNPTHIHHSESGESQILPEWTTCVKGLNFCLTITTCGILRPS